MPSSNDEFWASLNDTSSLMSPPAPRPYHYLTRSQSLGSYQPKHHQVSATQQQQATSSMGYGNTFGSGAQHTYQLQPHVPFHYRQQLQKLEQQRQEQQQQQQYQYQYGQNQGPSPLRSEYDPREHDDEHEDADGDADAENMRDGSGGHAPGHGHGFGVWEAATGRPLSPIDEGALSYSDADSPTGGVVGGNRGGQVNNDDAVSVHSTHSSLFLKRPVRRTPSNTTMISVTSAPPRFSPIEPPHTTSSGPPRTYKRSPSTLSMIPQSPRASQTVTENGSQIGAVLTPPPAVIYPQHLPQHPSFHQSLEDAIDRHARLVNGYEVGYDGMRPTNSSTPSLVSLNRTESVRTQLTYATGEYSAAASRRQSAVSPMEGANGAGESKMGMAAKLKESLDTLMSKSSKLTSAAKSSLHLRSPYSTKPPGNIEDGLGGAPETKRFSVASWRKSIRDTAKGSKPAEFLFWTGFIAPWCWLIGGWMLANNGEPVVEGFPKDAKMKPEHMSKQHSTSTILPMYNDAFHSSRTMPYGQGEKVDIDEGGHYGGMTMGMGMAGPSASHQPTYPYPYPADADGNANYDPDAKQEPISIPMPEPEPYQHYPYQASVTLMPIPGRPKFLMRRPKVRLRSPKAVQARKETDPWVLRCRVMAIVSGMVILALVIVAFIVLIRAL